MRKATITRKFCTCGAIYIHSSLTDKKNCKECERMVETLVEASK